MKSRKTCSLTVLIASLAAAAPASAENLTDLDLKSLMDMDVNITSVAKRPMRVADSPAAVTVITQDDLRRLGITRVPEALRLVPGLDVARINGSTWAISARGFNQQYSNKLLVLIDGRTVYSPSFGGVFWDAQDLVIEDIERIEVIRGPGATLWGANAVNGVINVITRSARDTQGGLLESAAGTEAQPFVSARYGARAGDNAHFRTYAKAMRSAPLVDSTGHETHDGSDSLRAGFRADWDRSDTEMVTVQGDGYWVREDESAALPRLSAPFSELLNTQGEQSGANILGRWSRGNADGSYSTLQTYVDHFRHEGRLTIERRDTFDIQWEQRSLVGRRHGLTWGLGYRFTQDEFNETPAVAWDPTSRDLDLFTMFVQDELALMPDRLSLTVGSKFEHNDYTGLEVQPSARLLWRPRDGQTLWASFSRAVSTPARVHRDARVTLTTFQPSPAQPVVEVILAGSKDVDSERLNAYELGYRVDANARLSLDLAGFYNRYDGLMSVGTAGTSAFALTPVPHVTVQQSWVNLGSSHTYGAEASLQWQALDAWRMTANYSYIETGSEQGAAPSQQASLRSYVNLPRGLELNAAMYYVDSISAPLNSGSLQIPSYVRVDIGTSWRVSPALELGIWGQNLLDRRHAEITSFTTPVVTEIPRSVLARASWHFQGPR